MNRKLMHGGDMFRVAHEPLGVYTWNHANANTYEPETFACLNSVTRMHERAFVDIGAYVGVYTMWAARRYGYVLAYEPDDVAMDVLRRNLYLNALTTVDVRSDVVLDGSPAPWICRANSKSGVENSRKPGAPMRPTITLNRAVEIANDQVVIKLDTEGSEADILLASIDYVREARPMLLISLHPQNWGGRNRLPEIATAVENHWRVYDVQDGRDITGHVETAGDQHTLFCVAVPEDIE